MPGPFPICIRSVVIVAKMIDLGRWFNEQYAIERDLMPEDLPNLPPPMDQP